MISTQAIQWVRDRKLHTEVVIPHLLSPLSLPSIGAVWLYRRALRLVIWKSRNPLHQRLPKKPRLRGALRGLDLDNRLSQAATETSIEDHDPAAPADGTPRHETRSTRNGRANVNYSQKWHPMDEVTRPKRAQRITGTRSLSASASHRESETSGEEEPELHSGSESSDSDDQGDDVATPTERMPDPRAVRHSARAEARKPVNYSKKYHPQDDAIPGFGRRTKRKRRNAQTGKHGRKQIKSQTSVDKPIVLSSEKVIDSDSDDRDGIDAAQIVHTSPGTTSSRKQQLENPETQHVVSDGEQTSSSNDESRPGLSRGESSFNEAENIIQGKHIAQMQRIKQATNEPSDAGDATTDSPDINFDEVSTKEIGATMETIFDNIETPDISECDTESGERNHSDECNFKPPQTITPVALVTPASEDTSEAPKEPCTPARTQLTINRPYLATQLEATQESNKLQPSCEDLSESAQALLSSQPASAAAEHEDPFQAEQRNRDSSTEAHRKDLRDNFEQAARVARAKEITNRLSSDPTIPDHDNSGPSCKSSNSVSRQVSRDTLPDDPSSNHFEEAIAVTLVGSQHESDGESFRRSPAEPDDPSSNHSGSGFKSSNSASRQISRDTLPDDPSSNHFEEAIAVTLVGSQHESGGESFRPSPAGYSQLPVSDRERSDVYASQERSSQEVASFGADNHEHGFSSRTAGSSQRQDDDQMATNQQQGQSSDVAPSFVDEPGQTTPVSSSKDSALLRPSSP